MGTFVYGIIFTHGLCIYIYYIGDAIIIIKKKYPRVVFHVAIQKRKGKWSQRWLQPGVANHFYMSQIWLQPLSKIATRNYKHKLYFRFFFFFSLYFIFN